MSKKNLIATISEQQGITRAEAERQVNAVLLGLGTELRINSVVRLADFGSLTVKRRTQRAGVNPATGKAMTIPAKNVVRFNAYPELERQVN